jgi:Cu2+-exporting ATPase
MADASSARDPATLAVPIHAPGVPPADVGDLVAALDGQPSVASVVHDAAGGTLVIRYDDRRGAGAVLAAIVRDRLRAAQSLPPEVEQRIEVAVAHELPGRVRFKVTGGVADAPEKVAALLGGVPGVERVRPSPAAGSVLVLFDPRLTSTAELLAAIDRTPPTAWPTPPAASSATTRHEMLKAGFSLGVLAASISGIVPVPIMLGGVALTAIPPFKRAVKSLGEGRLNVDVMDATAIAVCVIRAEPITASVITALLAIGDLILDRTHDRARTAISRLMQLDDGEAFVVDDEGGLPRRIHPREIRVGMRIVIYPGARVPADGVVVDGSIAVDEKAVTGESVPRDRLPGDRVMAASVALHGQATVEVERAGSDTVAARIVQILEGAGVKPMTLQRNAERYADRLVPPTFITAGLAYAASGVVDRLTAVLITDFGTGVRVAVPTAALAAMVQAARAGVLVKGAQYLERLAEVDTIVFDKTGTLTLGVPEVTEIVRIGGRWSVADVAALAAAAEGNQSHPIADALRRHAVAIEAPRRDLEQGSENYRIGLGLSARVRGHEVMVGNSRMMREAGVDPAHAERIRDTMAEHGASSVIVAVDGQLAGVIGYADAPRPESRDVIRALRAGGRRRVLLLSGDARAPVEAIARMCGIDEAIGEVLPEQKAEVVRRLKSEGRKVAMVGDGINDAPALAVADVGVSLRGGTEVALETADVVLLEGGLERLPEVLKLSEDAMARVKEVLGIVLAPNAVAIAAGALGFINPVMAAAVNNGSTIAAALHAVTPLLFQDRAQKTR